MLYLIVLLEGFVTISLEILTIRQLTPIVGNSIIVTSLIIGIFLLFLAHGYRKGGIYSSDYKHILKKNFLLASIGFGLGLSYAFIELFFNAIRGIAPHTTLLPLTLYLLLVIAPVVYWLGQTVPITLNMWKKQSSVGGMGGEVLHLSTIGSFLGATLTALILLNYFGVAWSVFFDFAILALLTLILMDIKNETLRFVGLMTLGFFVYWINLTFEKSFFVTTDNYSNYAVWNVPSKAQEHGQILVINDSFSSYTNEKKQGFAVIELIKKILFDDMKLQNKNILVLGAGGFSISAEKTNGNHFTYVDIDKHIAEIVKKHFQPNINGDFVADDARHYLNTIDKRYDAIVVDAYNNTIAIAPHLLTREYFAALKNSIVDQGVVIFNIFAKPTLDDAYSRRVDNTIRSVFGSCMVIPLSYVDRPGNIVYVCRKSLADNKIYTDDLNQATMDFFEMK